MLFFAVCNARALLQQLLRYHSLLVYPVKGRQVAQEGACLHLSVAVMAGDAARLPIVARVEPETHAMIGGGRQLGLDPTRSADHGLRLQAIGF